MSKEFWILEHEFYAGIGTFMFWGMLYKYVSPEFSEWVYGEVEKKENELKAIRQDEIDR